MVAVPLSAANIPGWEALVPNTVWTCVVHDALVAAAATALTALLAVLQTLLCLRVRAPQLLQRASTAPPSSPSPPPSHPSPHRRPRPDPTHTASLRLPLLLDDHPHAADNALLEAPRDPLESPPDRGGGGARAGGGRSDEPGGRRRVSRPRAAPVGHGRSAGCGWDSGSPIPSSLRSNASTWLDRAADYLHENVLDETQPQGWSTASLPPAPSPLMGESTVEAEFTSTPIRFSHSSDSSGTSDSALGYLIPVGPLERLGRESQAQWESPMPQLHGGPRLPQLTDSPSRPRAAAVLTEEEEEEEEEGTPESTWVSVGYGAAVAGMVVVLPLVVSRVVAQHFRTPAELLALVVSAAGGQLTVRQLCIPFNRRLDYRPMLTRNRYVNG
jgi:hypothetical protein